MQTELMIAANLSLPASAVTEVLAWLGRRGFGKTYGATKMAEEMIAAKAQVIALDPVGVWWGLRLASDGKSKGFDIPIFGGLNADIPITPSSGGVVADDVVEHGVSAVIDTSQFETDAAKNLFVQTFAERFFFRKKAAPSAIHLFVEEAQEFCPQNLQRGVDEHVA
jgi:uncharacterized protein